MCLKTRSVCVFVLEKDHPCYLLTFGKAVTSPSGFLPIPHMEHFKNKLEDDFSYPVCSVLSH